MDYKGGKTVKKAIIGIAIIIIILIALVVLTSYYLHEEKIGDNKILNEGNSTETPVNEEITHTIERVTNRDMFYTVSSCVEKYLDLITVKDSEKIYNLLANEYKSQFNITQENIWDYIESH